LPEDIAVIGSRFRIICCYSPASLWFGITLQGVLNLEDGHMRIDVINKGLKKLGRVPLHIVSGLFVFVVLLANPLLVQAQPEATFEFESMFGKRDFYTQTFPPNLIAPEGFTSPTGVTFFDNQQIIVADRGNDKLQSCNLEGDCFWIGLDGAGQAGGTRHQRGTFTRPFGVEMNNQGRITVADEGNHWLQLCDELSECDFAGRVHGLRVEPSSSLGQMDSPSDVAVDANNLMYISDTNNNRIQVFNTDMNFEDIFGRLGNAPGEFNSPKGISIDPQGRIVIADAGNHRVQICDVEGECETFGSMGSAAGQFNSPAGLDVDGLGRIWVADTGNHRIQVCDDQGTCQVFGEFGTGSGQFDGPSDIEVHHSGLAAVADTNNHRIQLFRTETAFRLNAGLNDAWYNPVTDGQGFFITVFPELGLVLLAWFTYDTELPPADAQAHLGDAGHRWLIAVGNINGNQSEMEIEIASGGVFDTATDIQREMGGTIKLSFDGCKSGKVEYDITSINQQGVVPIQRVANDNTALCEALINQ
jgi:DNA-binding beta-propeller fold protein YncE